MAYSTATGVKAYFGNTIWSTNTAPTLAQVETWCDEAAAIIDSYISCVVATPVVDATDLKIITSISDLYVTDNISFVQGKNRIMMQQGSESVPRSISHKSFYDKLNMIKDGTLVLASSTPSSKLESYSGTVENSRVFVSSKDTDLW